MDNIEANNSHIPRMASGNPISETNNQSHGVTIKFTPDGIPITDFSNDPAKVIMDNAIHWLSILILIEVMLGLGCTVDVSVLKKHIKRPVGVAIATVTQFVLMPLLVFGIATATHIHTVAAVTILVTASVPGGSLSNILAYLIEGDLALSMLMTACSSMLAFAFIPFNLFVYGSHWLPANTDYQHLIPFPSVILSLVLMMVPVAVGVIINWRWPTASKYIVTVCKVMLGLTITSLAVLSGLLYKDTLLRYMPKEMWAFCVFMPLVGNFLGYFISLCARMEPAHRRTVMMETGCQNGQLGCAILKVAFPNELIGSFFIFPLLYSVFQLTEGLILVAIFKFLKKRREESKESAARESYTVKDATLKVIRTVSHVIDSVKARRKSGAAKDEKDPVVSDFSETSSDSQLSSFANNASSDVLTPIDAGALNRAYATDPKPTNCKQ